MVYNISEFKWKFNKINIYVHFIGQLTFKLDKGQGGINLYEVNYLLEEIT